MTSGRGGKGDTLRLSNFMYMGPVLRSARAYNGREVVLQSKFTQTRTVVNVSRARSVRVQPESVN